MVSKNDIGEPITLGHREIRLMLRLANASESDVFYDLGCGAGLVCCLAVSEFKVKLAVGIENYKPRVRMAQAIIQRYKLQNSVEIRHEEIEDTDFSDATIVYYGLTEDEDTLEMFEESLAEGCRLITLESPLLGIIPDAVAYPFYMSKFPFARARTAEQWFSATLLKQVTIEEAIEELRNAPKHTWSFPVSKFKKILTERLAKKSGDIPPLSPMTGG